MEESGLSLSGGQKQRISPTQALIRDPKLSLMDEPTANLDGLGEEEIAELIQSRFQNTAVTYLPNGTPSFLKPIGSWLSKTVKFSITTYPELWYRVNGFRLIHPAPVRANQV